MQRQAISRFGHVGTGGKAEDIVTNTSNIETNTQAIQTLQTSVTQLDSVVETKQINLGSYEGHLYTLQPTLWSTLFNASANGGLFIQNSYVARAISKPYSMMNVARDFVFEIKALTPHRHWIGISDSNTNTSTLAPDSQAYWFKISAPSVEDNFLRSYTSSSSFTDVTVDNGVTYAAGDRVKFEINSSNELRVYLDAGSGYNQISTTVYTLPQIDFYGRITDSSISAGDSEIELQVTDVTPDFTNKANKLNIYDNYDIQFENETKISRDTDDFISLSADSIDVFKNIQSTSTISCTSLFTTNALMPVGTTAKMLTTGLYPGQLFYNTSEGMGKFCVYTGNTWQVPGETVELLCSQIVSAGQVMITDTTTNLSCTKVTTTISTNVIGVVACNSRHMVCWCHRG